MGRVDDSGDRYGCADGRNAPIDPPDDGAASASDDEIRLPDDESGRRPPEREDGTPEHGTLLSWMIPQLEAVERECAVLLDSGEEVRHAAAAHSVLTALQLGVRRILELDLRLPTFDDSAVAGTEARSFLHQVGTLLNQAVRKQGMTWPPPHPRPPTAVTRDLISLYDLATLGSRDHDPRPDVALRKALLLIDGRATALLTAGGRISIEAAQAMAATPPGTTRSRIGLVLSGAAMVISLLQGPGAAHDFYHDSLTLGGDVRRIAVHVVSAIADSWNRSVAAISRKVDDRPRGDAIADVPGNESGKGIGGAERMTGAEANMGRVLASLDEAITHLPTALLAQANADMETVIETVQVLDGSADYDTISGTADAARQQIQATYEAVHLVREQLKTWMEQHGGMPPT